jgi:hypothetical protein
VNHSTCPWSAAPSCVEGGASNPVASCFSSLLFRKSFSVFPFRYVASWIDRRRHQSEKANLTILFDKYIPVCLEKLRTSFKAITSVPESSLVQVCVQPQQSIFYAWESLNTIHFACLRRWGKVLVGLLQVCSWHKS